MFRILYFPFPDDNSALLPCKFRGRVVDVRPCEICGSAAGPKGRPVPIRECLFKAEDGREHPLCAAAHFEAVRRVHICSNCEDRKEK